MFNYGKAPGADQIEVTLFGPGYGEAIALHLGDGDWMLVDSCIPKGSRLPASLDYLNRIGVPPESVKVVVASHWHDDHVKGMSELAAHFTEADFYMSSVFQNNELATFFAAHGSEVVGSLTRGMKELFKSVKAAKKTWWAFQRTTLFERSSSKKVRICAFSPTQSAQRKMLERLAGYIPKKTGSAIGHAPDLGPNLEAIVLHVDFDGDAILLGSDMEVDKTTGWPEILVDPQCASKTKASLYKVSHHGSDTGDHPGIWTELTVNKPFAALTPFHNGSNRLPKDSDLRRIKATTSAAFITSTGSKKPSIPQSLKKRMDQMCQNLAVANTTFGAVRLRKTLGSKNWDVERFGAAIIVK